MSKMTGQDKGFQRDLIIPIERSDVRKGMDL